METSNNYYIHVSYTRFCPLFDAWIAKLSPIRLLRPDCFKDNIFIHCHLAFIVTDTSNLLATQKAVQNPQTAITAALTFRFLSKLTTTHPAEHSVIIKNFLTPEPTAEPVLKSKRLCRYSMYDDTNCTS